MSTELFEAFKVLAIALAPMLLWDGQPTVQYHPTENPEAMGWGWAFAIFVAMFIWAYSCFRGGC